MILFPLVFFIIMLFSMYIVNLLITIVFCVQLDFVRLTSGQLVYCIIYNCVRCSHVIISQLSARSVFM